MDKKRVAPDLDGCWYPFIDVFGRNMMRRHGIDIHPVEQHAFFERFEWTGKQFVEEMRDQILLDGLFLEGDPEPCAQTAAQMLHDGGLHVVIQTARRIPGAETAAFLQTYDWLTWHGIRYDELIVSNEKAPVDYAFDDTPKQIEAYRAAGTFTVVIDRPWNQGVDGPRAKNTIEAAEIILERHSLS